MAEFQSSFRRGFAGVLALAASVSLAACHHAPPASAPPPAAVGPGHGVHGAEAHWTYAGESGPAHWNTLSPEFASCSLGHSQSPIDIVSSSAVKATGEAPGPPPVRFGPVTRMAVPVTIVNNGHTIQVDSPGSSALMIGSDRYVLQQFHFHSPSEHTVDGRSFPLEAHFVHKTPDGKKAAVLGVLFEEGAENRGLAPFWAHLPPAVGVPDRLDLGGVSVTTLMPAGRDVYRYSGSLTTPPCSEDVLWIVAKDRGTVSPAQVAAFRGVVTLNNRPTQPLQGRTVYADAIR